MNQETALNRQSSESRPGLYMSLELSKERWRLAFTVGLGQKARERTLQVADLGRLSEEVERARRRFGLEADAPVRSCYEAGREGFWVHRWLLRQGIDNVVVDSSSILVERRARKAKSDGIDVRKLLGMLCRFHNGERKVFSVVRVPSEEDEDARHLQRGLSTLKAERTRLMTRVKELLNTQGIRIERRGVAELNRLIVANLRDWDEKPLGEGLQNRLCRELERLDLAHQQVQDVEKERRRAIRESPAPSWEKVRRLMRLKGIGENSATLFVLEFFAWRQFRNRRQLGSLAGLTPTPYQSGNSQRELGISKAGSRQVRSVAVEISWSWLRLQPGSELSRWYAQRFAAGGPRARKVGIVAVARKLLIQLWRFLEHGELPEGAELKP